MNKMSLPLAALACCALPLLAAPGAAAQGGPMFGGPRMGAPSITMAPPPLIRQQLHLSQVQYQKLLKIDRPMMGFGGPGGPGGPPPGGPGRPGGFGGPPPGGPGGGPPGGPGRPGGFGGMQKFFAQMRARQKKQAEQIMALLTPAQKREVPALLQRMKLYNMAGLPVDLIGKLHLSHAQAVKISSEIAPMRQHAMETMRKDMQSGNMQAGFESMRSSQAAIQSKVNSLLTAHQRALVQQFRSAHPMGMMGRPGRPPM